MEERLQLDLAWNRVVLDGATIELTATECRLLAYLAEVFPRCVPGEELLAEVWGRGSGKARVVKTTIHRLRQKLEPNTQGPTLLVTVPGRGYRLTLTAASAPLRPLPDAAGAWVDRPALRERVEAALVDERVAFLVGPGGSGKTRLGSEVLGAVGAGYPGGAARVDVAGTVTLARLVGGVADALQIPLEGDAVAQVGRALAARDRCLLLFDNLDHAPPAVFECLEGWLASAPDLRLLLTSRAWSPLAGAVRVEVGPMSPDQAATLFATRAREAGEPPSPAEGVQALVRALDGVPLAVELAAACSDILTVEELTDRAGEPVQALRGVLRTAWSLLAPRTQAVLAQATVFVDGFTATAAEAVLRVPEGSPLADLRTLRSHALLERANGRFRMLPVLREAVRILSPDQVGAAEDRLVQWALTTSVERAREVGTPELDRALRWFRDERSNILEALDHARGHHPARALQIAVALCSAADCWGSMEHLEVLEQALATAPPGPERAWLLRFSARIQAASGSASRAEELFKEAREHCDPVLATQLQYDLGELWLVYGDYAQATGALEPLREVLPLALRANALRRLGEMARHRGDNDAAARDFALALGAAEAAGSVPVRLACLCSAGEYHHAAGRPAEAHAQLDLAVALSEKHGLTAATARALSLRGHAAKEDGNPDEARRTLSRACALQRRAGHSRGLMHILLRLGWIEAGVGDSASARAHLREGRLLADTLATPLVPFFEMNLAVCELDEGRPAAAVTRLDRALAMAEQGVSKLNLSTLLFHRAWALGAADRVAEALVDNHRALEINLEVAPAFAGENYALLACLVPTDRDALHQARERMTGERDALGAIRVLQIRQNRPDAPLTPRVQADAQKSAFGRQVLRWLER